MWELCSDGNGFLYRRELRARTEQYAERKEETPMEMDVQAGCQMTGALNDTGGGSGDPEPQRLSKETSEESGGQNR